MLHARASAGALAVLRVAVFGGWLAYVLLDPTTDLALLPLSAYTPIGALRLLPEPAWGWLLSGPALAGLKVTLLALLAALVAGIRPFSPLALAACLLLTLHQGLVRSIGYINHGELALLMTAWVLAPFPAADALTIRGRRAAGAAPAGAAVYRAPLVAAAVVVCLTYTFVGTRRLATGGLQVFLDGSIVRMVAVRGLEPGPYGSGLGGLVLAYPALAWAFQAGFPVVTALEVLALGCLGWPRFRRVWIAAMVLGHLAVQLFMQIPFRANVVLVLLLLTELPAAIGRRLADGDAGGPAG